MALKFTSTECNSASESLKQSAAAIDRLLEEFEELIGSVSGNYESDASSKISEAFKTVKAKGPEFREAVEDCAKYLVNEVAPAYEKLEATAQQKVEG